MIQFKGEVKYTRKEGINTMNMKKEAKQESRVCKALIQGLVSGRVKSYSVLSEGEENRMGAYAGFMPSNMNTGGSSLLVPMFFFPSLGIRR